MPLASAAVDVPGQVPLSTKENLEPGQSKGLREEELINDQIFDFLDPHPSVIQDEPPETTEEDGSNGAFALDASKRHVEAASRSFTTDVAFHQQDSRSHFAFGERPRDKDNLYYHYPNAASPVDEAEEGITNPERVPQVREGEEFSHPDAESISRAKISNRRFAMVEESGPEIEEAE
ncbi:MAG: hypothetical protein L6R42_000329 [Xanthoria sp. 1 TBL-2021]|nr:MAG: hypothetical protein L6R42_000329 [Xanthoria sp. 1 TBL-2021]